MVLLCCRRRLRSALQVSVRQPIPWTKALRPSSSLLIERCGCCIGPWPEAGDPFRMGEARWRRKLTGSASGWPGLTRCCDRRRRGVQPASAVRQVSATSPNRRLSFGVSDWERCRLRASRCYHRRFARRIRRVWTSECPRQVSSRWPGSGPVARSGHERVALTAAADALEDNPPRTAARLR